MMGRPLIPLAAALFVMPGAARAAEQDAQLWLQAATSVQISDDWTFTMENNIRFSDDRRGLYQIENNFLLGYNINETVTIWAGYTHDPQYDGGTFTVMERRAREQVTFDDVAKIGSGTLGLRLRAEQRWRDGVDGTGWRLRPYAKYVLPLSADGKTTLTLGHESFINLNSTSFQSRKGWDRMRNSIAVKRPLSRVLSADIGYLNQYTLESGGPNRMDHAVTLGISLSL